MLGRQEENKPLGQLGQYVGFPSTSLLLPFWTENELSLGQPGQYVGFPSTSLLLPFFNDNELSFDLNGSAFSILLFSYDDLQTCALSQATSSNEI